MRSSTLLDSAIFQLTPTRTRCDLIITANGKTEKITTGLLNPFLAHLKTAQDQIAKGGYSILLEPESGRDASWFTKGTLERFVRFVSTPDILERVYTIESEILQIEEAIVIQGKNDLGLNNVEHRQPKPVTNHEASITMPDANEEKAIILYKPDAQHEANGSDRHEESSKVQLLKVLESRKANLQKEQGMAFARAVAAGFDIDRVTPLLSFAECFGATRLMSACSLFMDLWKRKHESGQLLEIQKEAEAMSNIMNTSGTMLSNNKPHSELASDNKGNEIIGGEERHPMDQKSPGTQQEYYQGQFPHPGFPSWPMHSPPGTLPIYPTYPVQGVPYYQGFPGNGALYQPPYRMDGYQPNNDLELIKDESINQELRKKTSRLGKKKSGGVVIKNINYISKRKNSSDSESESSSESEIGQESQDTRDGTSTAIDKNPASFKRKGERAKAELFKNDHHETSYGNETDSGPWQAFQNILLRDADEDKKCITDNGMFASEKNIQMKRKPNLDSEDPLTLGNQNPDGHGHNATKYMEMRGKGIYRSTTDDRFMVDGREHQQFRNSSDPLVVDGFEYTSNNLSQSSPGAINDESFIVPFRSMTLDQIGIDDRTTIDVNSELPSKLQKSEYNSFKDNKSSYEPYDLNLMPERRVENETAGYDPDLEYKLQVRGTVAKNLDEDRKSKALPDTSDKKKSVGPIRKAKPSKMSPLDDARARAEKLRSYKADLQKMKKENEEKELKRLEALKIERLKRIATKGSSTPTRSLLHSPQSKKQLPTTKLSPSSHPGSKFSDSQPGPTSPLQRSKIRISSNISSTSNSASKTSKTSNSSQLARNRLVRSVSSLPDPNKEDNGVASDTKASMARIRRLSEPRTMNNPNVVPPVKRSLESVSKPKVLSENDSKKVSPIINPTKSKVKRTIDGRIKPAAKEMTEKVETAKIFKLSIKQTVCDNDIDTHENPVIEKTLVMLECGKPSVVVPHASSEHVGQQTGQFDNKEESIDMKKGKKESENGLHMHGVSKLAGGGKQDRIVAHEEMTRLSEEKQQKFDGNSAVEKPYQAPYARPSSFDDKCDGNSEYAKAPSVMLDMTVAETSKIHVSGSNGLKLERIPEMPEMLPQLKESPKGFKRLLQFGKKNRSSSSSKKKLVSDNASYGSEAGETATTNAVYSEVRTLKNLISLDESPPTSGSKSQKPSRHFSLLTSPFRSKTC
ncbi:COP1-interacting protein 7-like isoform X2 [Impatiens glandulifera]|uniref:COP1-interacting protein 7-like isoform X2 n=1 Tax=Impatiens glandulifera TaxID=253017 RepID=UPI001FB08570|nr:COP1-interacting protein 7-like isoform X2 [Impatiens glandulifera]